MARSSTSDATTRAAGCLAFSTAAMAPLPVHRSMAVPASGKRAAARRCQRLTLQPRDVDPGIDPDIDIAELHVSGDPGQRLTGEATGHDEAQ